LQQRNRKQRDQPERSRRNDGIQHTSQIIHNNLFSECAHQRRRKSTEFFG
jgi:hypothetical protein